MRPPVVSKVSTCLFSLLLFQNLACAASSKSLEPPRRKAGATSILLPLEVMGPPGSEASASFRIADPAGADRGLRLALTLHAYDYPDKGSVRVNSADWVDLNETTLQIDEAAKRFGGIGGGFRTFRATVRLPWDVLVVGENSITFRFNRTNGRSSGFRVLGFNLLLSNGEELISQEQFAEDDPTNWQPPLPDLEDVEEGRRIWNEASLTVPPDQRSIQARCGSCHARDGRDLKYFNYSNFSIRSRAVFHGLTPRQGDQVASYIRSLNVPSPGRPWNPPYQPGPGQDAEPVEKWAAGAGLNAVLDRDPKIFDSIAPNDDVSGWVPSANVSARETPIALQLPDWNGWLPGVHPIDGFSDFNGNAAFAYYDRIRNSLRSSDGNSYRAVLGMFNLWHGIVFDYRTAKIQSTSGRWDEASRAKVYSLLQWKLVKEWEMAQEFGLEAMNREAFGSLGEPRGWYGQTPFMTSPNMLQTGPGPGIGNGSRIGYVYLSYAWYHTQLILNNGNKQHSGTNPIDWPYVHGFVKELTIASGQPHPGIMMLWLIKGLQVQENDKGPEFGNQGWNHQVNAFNLLAHPDWQSTWQALEPSQKKLYHESYLREWIAKAKSFSADQFYRGGLTSSRELPTPQADGTLSDRMWYSIPIFRHQGIDPKITDDLIHWSATMWPAANWESLRNVTCSGQPVRCNY